MPTVKLSPKFQITVPKVVREALGLVAGDELQVIQFESRMTLIPLRTAKSSRGWTSGMSTTIPRDRDRV